MKSDDRRFSWSTSVTICCTAIFTSLPSEWRKVHSKYDFGIDKYDLRTTNDLCNPVSNILHTLANSMCGLQILCNPHPSLLMCQSVCLASSTHLPCPFFQLASCQIFLKSQLFSQPWYIYIPHTYSIDFAWSLSLLSQELIELRPLFERLHPSFLMLAPLRCKPPVVAKTFRCAQKCR